MSLAYIGLGANLGPARSTLRWALGELEQLGSVRASALYRTEPLGSAAQPWFVNAVAELRTELEPHALLRALLEIETRAGRPERRSRWAPRVLDLDLLLHDDRILCSAELSLPHPEFHARRFVLEPLAELAPELRDPRTQRSVRELLAKLQDPLRVERIWASTLVGPHGAASADASVP